MPSNMKNIAGILLEGIVVDFLIVFGLAGQKMAVMRLIEHDREEEGASCLDESFYDELFEETSSQVMTVTSVVDNGKDNDTRVPYVRELLGDGTWLCSFATYLVGNVLEMVALSLTTQTNVALLSNFTLLWNSLLATVIFKEDFNFLPVFPELSFKLFYRWDAFHCFILLAGSLMAVHGAPGEPEEKPDAAEELKRLFEPPFSYCALFMLVSMFVTSVLLFKNWRNLKTGNLNAALIAGLCAFLGTFTLTLSKVATNLISLTVKGNNQFGDPKALFLTILWIFCLVSQLSLLNIALGSFEQGVVIPIFEILGTISAVVAGILYNKTYGDFDTVSAVLFGAGIFLMLWGVWLVAHREVLSQQELSQKFHKNLLNVDALLRITSVLHSSPDFPERIATEDAALQPLVEESTEKNQESTLRTSGSSDSIYEYQNPNILIQQPPT